MIAITRVLSLDFTLEDEDLTSSYSHFRTMSIFLPYSCLITAIKHGRFTARMPLAITLPLILICITVN